MSAKQPSKANLTAYAVGVFGTFLILAGLVWLMYKYTQPAPVGQARVQERRKNLTELNGANVDALNHYGWHDQAKGLVRLPIAKAMDLVEKEYQNPAAARSNLVARSDKASAPAPKAPEKPNQYE